MSLSSTVERPGWEVRLHNLQLQLGDIEDAIAQVRELLEGVLIDSEPVVCESCGLIIPIRQAIREEWQEYREDDGELVGFCAGCLLDKRRLERDSEDNFDRTARPKPSSPRTLF